MGEHTDCTNLPQSKDSTIFRLKLTISTWWCRYQIYAILSCSVGETPYLGNMHCVCWIHWRCGAGGLGGSVRFLCHLGHISLRWRSVLCVSLRVLLFCSATFVWFVRQRGFSESSKWQTNQLRFLCVSCVSLCYRFVIPCYLHLPCFFLWFQGVVQLCFQCVFFKGCRCVVEISNF